MLGNTSLSVGQGRPFIVGISCALLAEVAVLISLAILFRDSWADELIGIGVLALGLLIPSLISLGGLLEASRLHRSVQIPIAALVWGVALSVLILSLAFFAGDHSAPAVVLLGLAIQGVIHSVAALRIRQVIAT